MPQVIILDENGKHNRLYTSWTGSLSCTYEFAEGYDLQWQPPRDCSLVVTAQQYQSPEVPLLIKCVQIGIPVLLIADGILEYRNTWLRPDTPNGCMFQPVIGHKIAVIGRSQARILESWGNAGKCEIVGIPRFDDLLQKKVRPRSPVAPFRILVMTAKVPAFTEEQFAESVAGICDLKMWFERNHFFEGVEVEPVWRLEKRIAETAGIKTDTATDLASLLAEVDAVISTPSTGMLEAMLACLPVARLEYGNYPPYLNTAWNITSASHLTATVRELLHPPAAKMLYQDTMLHDALECLSPATPRMVRLIEEMVRMGEGGAADFPRNILPAMNDVQEREQSLDMAALYPTDPVFLKADPLLLQAQVSSLKIKLLNQERDFAEYRRLVESHSFLGRIRANWGGVRSNRPTAHSDETSE